MDRDAPNSEKTLLRSADVQTLRQALDQLPVEFREVVVLRELEGLSYKQIGDITGIPLRTVMSRLARGRRHLQQGLLDRTGKEARR
jgi:RNA polymerase sigma-70 factor (ECF subfamily)